MKFSSLFALSAISKCKIKCQSLKEDYISRFISVVKFKLHSPDEVINICCHLWENKVFALAN